MEYIFKLYLIFFIITDINPKSEVISTKNSFCQYLNKDVMFDSEDLLIDTDVDSYVKSNDIEAVQTRMLETPPLYQNHNSGTQLDSSCQTFQHTKSTFCSGRFIFIILLLFYLKQT